MVVTGASDGIGAVAAYKLYQDGATVVVIGRSAEKTVRVAKETGGRYYIADFSRLHDVRQLASQLRIDYPQIDVLINNAGGVFGKRTLTEDGHEKTLQVNHLAHFLLTNSLMDILIQSRAAVINTSSIANRIYGKIFIEDLDLQNGYTPERAYGNSKLANILFTKELHKRYSAQGLSTVAVHPGNIATNFARDSTSWMRLLYRTPLAKLVFETPQQGAEPLLWFASTTPGVDWISGEYYEKHKIGRPNKQAYDDALAGKLWELSSLYTSEQKS